MTTRGHAVYRWDDTTQGVTQINRKLYAGLPTCRSRTYTEQASERLLPGRLLGHRSRQRAPELRQKNVARVGRSVGLRGQLPVAAHGGHAHGPARRRAAIIGVAPGHEEAIAVAP